jgi:hypothetical protein
MIKLPETSFEREKYLERDDLQRLLLSEIHKKDR